MSNNLAVATLDTFKKDATVKGLSITTSEKTGASRITLLKKKDFVEGYKRQHPDASTKTAQRAFEQYRVQTLNEWNAKIAQQIAGGHIVVESARADDNGDLRTFSLVKRDARERDNDSMALARVARLTGMSVDDLARMAKTHTPNAAIDVQAIEAAANTNGDEAAPSEGKPEESKPEESKPAESKPEESKPAEGEQTSNPPQEVAAQ